MNNATMTAESSLNEIAICDEALIAINAAMNAKNWGINAAALYAKNRGVSARLLIVAMRCEATERAAKAFEAACLEWEPLEDSYACSRWPMPDVEYAMRCSQAFESAPEDLPE